MNPLAFRVAARAAALRIVALEVGKSTFTEHLKLHHFHGSLQITEMQNAGKRGKKVRELTLIPKTLNDELSDKIVKQAVSSISHMSYDEAKKHLEDILSRSGHENLFKLREQTRRGIDVEPAGTTIDLEKKFPDDTIVSIHASPRDFRVTNSVVIHAEGKAADGYRQDTNYWPRGRQGGIAFYGWLKDNMSKASNMTILELEALWEHLGIQYDSH
jgi:hypothetical protein